MYVSSFAPLSAIGRFVERQRAARAESRTRWLIEQLPRHMRKDIGWPDAGLPHARSDRGGGWDL